jgi:hypothetical protein
MCSQRFEAVRSDAKYCSGACKQKAHQLRSKKSPSQEEPKLSFNHLEYEAVIKDCGLCYEDLPFVMYCFQRRNLQGDLTINQITNFILSLWLDRPEVAKLKSFQIFQEDFFTDKYTITTDSV